MADLEAHMNQMRETMVESFRNGKVKEAAKGYYTKDCLIMGPQWKHVLRGNQNEEWIKELEGKDPISFFNRDDVIDLGDAAVERGHYGFSKLDGTPTSKGFFVQVWKKEDGVLRVHMLIFTD